MSKLVKESLNEWRYVTKELWDIADEETKMTYLLSSIKDPDEAEEFLYSEYDELPAYVVSNMMDLSESLNESSYIKQDFLDLYYENVNHYEDKRWKVIYFDTYGLKVVPENIKPFIEDINNQFNGDLQEFYYCEEPPMLVFPLGSYSEVGGNKIDRIIKRISKKYGYTYITSEYDEGFDEDIVVALVPIKNTVMRESLDEKLNLFKSKSPEEKRKLALRIIDEHPTKRALYKKLKAESPQKAKQLVNFIMKNPETKYFKWDEKIQDFVDTSAEYIKESVGGKVFDANGVPLKVGNQVQAIRDLTNKGYFPKRIRQHDVFTIYKITAGGFLIFSEFNDDRLLFDPDNFQLF